MTIYWCRKNYVVFLTHLLFRMHSFAVFAKFCIRKNIFTSLYRAVKVFTSCHFSWRLCKIRLSSRRNCHITITFPAKWTSVVFAHCYIGHNISSIFLFSFLPFAYQFLLNSNLHRVQAPRLNRQRAYHTPHNTSN